MQIRSKYNEMWSQWSNLSKATGEKSGAWATMLPHFTKNRCLHQTRVHRKNSKPPSVLLLRWVEGRRRDLGIDVLTRGQWTLGGRH